jgi:aspartate-semialdehyde dehydrogenase
LAEHKLLAIVGADTLLGRELRDVLTEAGLASRIRTIAAGQEEPAEPTAGEEEALTGQDEDDEELDEVEDLFLESLEHEAYADAAALLLAGSPASCRRTFEIAAAHGIKVIDLTGALEDQPSARLRAPSLEEPAHQRETELSVIAHPAASALARFFRAVHSVQPIHASVVTVLEPASERGQAGLDELHQQTVRLLSFQSLPKHVFDAQIGFNVLSEYGEQAPLSLASVQQRIERCLATLLTWGPAPPPMPSLRLIQAPVFHGHSFSLWVEFESAPDLSRLIGGLEAAGIDVRSGAAEPPTNAGAAGQSGITVGSISADPNRRNAVWFWTVADNLRLTADHALEVVREILP